MRNVSDASLPDGSPTNASSGAVWRDVAVRARRATGLFAELLGGALEPLADDMDRTPARYEDAARALVERLLALPASERALGDDERRLLDEATWALATAPRARAHEPRPVVVGRPPREGVRHVAQPRALPPYWWL
jgi:hypothetical protein